ncbi:site-specific integrase [Marinomonas sp.]|uniref:site-specific integrase n=1 Tax=Marinomonas sp. TaxID=1904862 RepID=UPI003BA9779C
MPKKNNKWPKYVREVNGRIVWRPRITAEDRTVIDVDSYGFLKPPVRLGSVKDSEERILSAYLSAKTSLTARTGADKHTLKWIIDQYLNSSQFRALASTTHHRTKSLVKVLEHPIAANGKDITFGDVPIITITKPMVRRLADKRLDNMIAEGLKGTSTINQEMSLLHSATRWAIEHIDDLGITDSPFKVKKFKVDENERYVTDEEYDVQYQIAAELSEYLPLFFELTYLIASRGVETLDLRTSHIDPDPINGGIYVTRRKGSKNNFIEWSDRLYKAYQAAVSILEKHKANGKDVPLIISSTGYKLSMSGLRTAMHRLKETMAERDLKDNFWSLHLLKSKGVSDAESDHIAGHKTESMRNKYKTKIERHKAAR